MVVDYLLVNVSMYGIITIGQQRYNNVLESLLVFVVLRLMVFVLLAIWMLTLLLRLLIRFMAGLPKS